MALAQSAVSRQIAHLEDWLQLRLFERRGRRVMLTTEGRDYAEAMAPALDRIRRATARSIERRPDRELTIAARPGFGVRWLAPRLPRLTAQYPDLIINLAARSTEFDFGEENFDAAIHFGQPDGAGVDHDLLFRERAIPVASPVLLAANCVRLPADLVRIALLTLASRRRGWSEWFAHMSIGEAVPVPSATFEQFLMLGQAAVAGTGSALIPSFLIEPEIASGALFLPVRSLGAGIRRLLPRLSTRRAGAGGVPAISRLDAR